jgi:hypothetical protein
VDFDLSKGELREKGSSKGSMLSHACVAGDNKKVASLLRGNPSLDVLSDKGYYFHCCFVNSDNRPLVLLLTHFREEQLVSFSKERLELLIRIITKHRKGILKGRYRLSALSRIS